MGWRILLAVTMGALPTGMAAGGFQQEEPPFGFANVKAQAAMLARRPFQSAPAQPEGLRRLTFDQYRAIAFRQERALWRDAGVPFQTEFYPRGYLFCDKIEIFLVEDGRARPFPFNPDLYRYGDGTAWMKDDKAAAGYAGVQLLCKLPERKFFQEFCAFLGASYFRAVCTNLVYGSSARGIAIDPGLPRPEEFPAFRTFWIERPTATAKSARIWTLLDGPSVAGAYQFTITPGLNETTLDLVCQLHFRKDVERLGLAPLTSMWSGADAHDADGLLIAGADGEWLWRPLDCRAPRALSRFQYAGLKGFGLMQRDRVAAHYRPNGMKYERRPNVWIKPGKPWGAGAVELLEFRSDVESVDNVAAWWVPKQPARAGDKLALSYQVAFMATDPPEQTGGRFVATQFKRVGTNDVAFTLTVAGDALSEMPGNADLQPVVTANHGRIVAAKCVKQPGGVSQLCFRLERAQAEPVELRAFIRKGSDVLTETWSMLCP